ncbi:DUF1294 domain-containing protein [Kangiella aquimarina]|uniref:Cold shock and DUF1294 domain-containing protein n=1 Tax=Kangiella aquimarina TaxID=261965 RepID=A0ABZ0X2T5_9GAMM|nr:cold shock and DUF1294 domain-containing protein [Kangiella aquimarina]WQG84906.1 cold shock and DUF1294 domain-containing protein [Kangiella aquimarina]
MRTKGKITTWDDSKGYGFITPLQGGERVFIHISAFANRNRRPQTNEIVTYQLSQDNKGRVCATKARLAGDSLPKRSQSKTNHIRVTVAIIAFGFVALSFLAGKIPLSILTLYVITSLITFLIYCKDKSAAKNKAWRTSEQSLHFLSLLGGWPGALIAQEKLRHKTNKKAFKAIFWITVFINSIAYIVFLNKDIVLPYIQSIL